MSSRGGRGGHASKPRGHSGLVRGVTGAVLSAPRMPSVLRDAIGSTRTEQRHRSRGHARGASTRGRAQAQGLVGRSNDADEDDDRVPRQEKALPQQQQQEPRRPERSLSHKQRRKLAKEERKQRGQMHLITLQSRGSKSKDVDALVHQMRSGSSQASSVPSTTAKRAREHEHDEHEQDPDLAPRAKLQKTSLSSATDRSNNGRTSSRFHEHDDDDDDDDDDDEMEGAGRQSQKLKLMHQLNQQRQQAKQVKKAPSKFMQLLQEQNLIPYESTDGSKLDHDDLEIARLEKKLSKRDLEIDDGLGGRASLPP